MYRSALHRSQWPARQGTASRAAGICQKPFGQATALLRQILPPLSVRHAGRTEAKSRKRFDFLGRLGTFIEWKCGIRRRRRRGGFGATGVTWCGLKLDDSDGRHLARAHHPTGIGKEPRFQRRIIHDRWIGRVGDTCPIPGAPALAESPAARAGTASRTPKAKIVAFLMGTSWQNGVSTFLTACLRTRTAAFRLLQRQEVQGVADGSKQIETRGAVILNAKVCETDHRAGLIQKRATT